MGFEKGRDNPCHGCQDRYPACSGHCKKPEFLKWQEEMETIRRNRAKNRDIEAYTAAEIRKSRRRCKR